MLSRTDSGITHRILANRSLAYLRSRRYEEALADGLAAVNAAPNWDKAHWRAGAALLALRKLPEAVAAFKRCWHCSGGAISSTLCSDSLLYICVYVAAFIAFANDMYVANTMS